MSLKKERVEVECENCHKMFPVISTMQFKRRFCSRSCSAQFKFTGRKHSEKTKRKIGEANKGHLKGVHRSPHTEFKKGHKSSEADLKKISNALKGNTYGFKKGHIPWNKGKKGYLPKEVWQKRPQCQSGKDNPRWKGGRKLIKAREHHKRRSFGFIPINNCDDSNWVAHHLDLNYVLFIPPELHRSVRHSLVNDLNMDVINQKAIIWYTTCLSNKSKITN